jgi:hypothetical protein
MKNCEYPGPVARPLPPQLVLRKANTAQMIVLRTYVHWGGREAVLKAEGNGEEDSLITEVAGPKSFTFSVASSRDDGGPWYSVNCNRLL